MTKYNLVPISRAPVYYAPTKLITQVRPVQIDENYFNKLAAFGLACLMAAIIGKLVMSLI